MIEIIKKQAIGFFGHNEKFVKYLDSLNNIRTITKGNINFHIIDSKDTKEDDYYKIQKNLDRIYKFANNFGFVFNIYLILSPFKKRFNKHYKLILNHHNTNTGFTYLTSSNIKRIFILRKEEYIKVIYHEIIHHISLIHNTFKGTNIIKLINHFKISNNNIDPNEAIIELWATIMFLRELSIDINKDFYELFIEELNYSLFKSYQIYLIQKKNNNGYWIDEGTNIYAYVYFKTILMYNLDKFYKIYTFPYNDDIITQFLIDNSNLPFDNIHPNDKRDKMSLCFMVNSDL